jgi:hypothetical protein
MAGPALAAQSPVVTDCNVHGALTHHYTADQLRNALNTMPPTVKEYTNCYDLINTALLAQVGSGSGGSAGKSSGGSFLPVWLIIVLAVLIIGGGGYAFLAFRRQGPAPRERRRRRCDVVHAGSRRHLTEIFTVRLTSVPLGPLQASRTVPLPGNTWRTSK